MISYHYARGLSVSSTLVLLIIGDGGVGGVYDLGAYDLCLICWKGGSAASLFKTLFYRR